MTNTHQLNSTPLINQIIDTCYEKMIDDHRVNRFFNTRPLTEQTAPLKNYVRTLISKSRLTEDEALDLLNDYFSASFARNNSKPSLVTGTDFGFLLDIVGGQEIRPITLLCESHSFLMKLLPDDDHYDVFIEHLTDTLSQLNVATDLGRELLTMAEAGREGFLGRGRTYMKAA
jgi:truncated hemoglobin YjbI